ncbi:MAG: DUF4097 family beta strand repeat protein [Cyclobacteriaceae bacterium]|nr:DUF4097 family beta strand repeat protein [Cyclobacteriaceae bacterium]
MKTRLAVWAGLVLMTTAAWGQEFKVARNSGRLEIHLGRVTLEGHNGNEIIFTSRSGKSESDPRSQGLRAINGLGLEDNTGLGINVTEKDGVVEVFQLKKMNSPDVKILVPRGVIVSCEHESQYGGTIAARNLENELEISTTYNSIELENITGPLTAKSVYGHIEATFSNNVKGPLSLVAVYSYVDVTLPANLKANLKLSTSYGEIFVAPEFKIEVERDGEFVNYSDKISGKINGGGMSVSMRADYGKIYLRKK